MGVWVVLIHTEDGCTEMDSLWDDKEEALHYVAQTFDERYIIDQVKVEWHRVNE